jgi:hypothetical protein
MLFDFKSTIAALTHGPKSSTVLRGGAIEATSLVASLIVRGLLLKTVGFNPLLAPDAGRISHHYA